MRALLLGLAACHLHVASSASPEEEIRRAWLAGNDLYLSTDWRWPSYTERDPDRGRELRVSLLDGRCEILEDAPSAPDPPRDPLVSLDHDVRASPTTVLHRTPRAIELVHASGVRQRLPLAKDSLVRWVLDTPLVLLDERLLVDVESGRRLPVRGARGFTFAADRIYVIDEGELAIFDLHLRELAREVPMMTLYTAPNGAVWKHAADDDLGWIPANNPWAVPIGGYHSIPRTPVTWLSPEPLPPGWRSPSGKSLSLPGSAATIEGSPLLVGDTWIASAGTGVPVKRPPGPVHLPAGVHLPYALIAGRAYQLTYDTLAHVPRRLGTIAHADAHVVVIMGSEARSIWVSRDGGPLRGYSIDRCQFH